MIVIIMIPMTVAKTNDDGNVNTIKIKVEKKVIVMVLTPRKQKEEITSPNKWECKWWFQFFKLLPSYTEDSLWCPMKRIWYKWSRTYYQLWAVFTTSEKLRIPLAYRYNCSKIFKHYLASWSWNGTPLFKKNKANSEHSLQIFFKEINMTM